MTCAFPPCKEVSTARTAFPRSVTVAVILPFAVCYLKRFTTNIKNYTNNNMSEVIGEVLTLLKVVLEQN